MNINDQRKFGVILMSGEEVFLIKNDKNTYTYPKGSYKKNEIPFDTAMREFKNKTENEIDEKYMEYMDLIRIKLEFQKNGHIRIIEYTLYVYNISVRDRKRMKLKGQYKKINEIERNVDGYPMIIKNTLNNIKKYI